MDTQVYVDPQGKEYDVPTDVNAADAAQIRQMKLRPKGDDWFGTKEFLKSMISGGAEGVARAPMFLADLVKLGMYGANKVVPNAVSPETINRTGSQPWLDAFKDSPQDKFLQNNLGLDLTHEPLTTSGRYAKAGTSAAAGALALGGVSSVPGILAPSVRAAEAARLATSPTMTGINTGAGLAGELGYDISRHFDETKPGNPLVAAAAALGTSGVGNTARAVFTPNLNQAIFNATKGMTADEWAATHADLKDFADSGSKSFTLADMPRLQERLGGLAQGLSNTTGGNLLQQKLSLQQRMNTDIPRLMKDVMDGVYGKDVDPRELAAILSAQGKGVVDKAIQARSTALAGNLDAAGNVDPAQLLLSTNKYVRQPMIRQENQGTGMQKALNNAEGALIGKEAATTPMIADVNPPVLNVRSLSQNVKALRNIPQSDTEQPSAAISRYQRMTAGDAAENALGEASPRFKTAMTQYGDTTENLVKPLEQGLPGGIQGAEDANGLLARLRKVPVDKLQGELNTLGVTPEQALQLAKVIGSRLETIPNITRAPDVLSLDREIFGKLVDFVNPDMAAAAGKKLSIADSLSRLSAEHSADRSVQLNLSKNPVSTIVNPFGTVSRRAGLRTTEGQAEKISELLGNPTPENLDRLRELSKVDPRAKRALEWVTSLVGAGQSAPPMLQDQKE